MSTAPETLNVKLRPAEQQRDLLKDIRADLDSALLDIVKANGNVKMLKATTCSYDPRSGCFTFKLEGAFKGGLSREEALYEQVAKQISGEQKEWDPQKGYIATPGDPMPPLFWEFNSNGERYTIVGANRGRSVIAARADGKRYKFKAEQIALHYAKKGPA